MMRIILFAALAIVISGCTVRQGAPIAGPSICDEQSFQGLVGRLATEIGPEELPTDFRFLGPNDAATQDARPERLNLFTDLDGMVIRTTCG